MRRVVQALRQARRDVAMALGGRASPTIARTGRHDARFAVAKPSPLAARPLRIARVERETPDAVSLYLADPAGVPIAFRPGQFLTFELHHDGERLRRAYSFAGAALDGHEPHVTVKRVSGGRASGRLVDRAREGDVVHVFGPSGDFVPSPLPPAANARRLVAIAGGSGITPIASILSTILATEPDSRVFLVYGNRSAADVIFRARLDELARRFAPRLVVDHVLEEPGDAFVATPGRLDRRTLASRLDAIAAPRDADVEHFVCGPTAMMEEARVALAERGIAPERVREERFATPERRVAPSVAAGPAQLRIRAHGTVRETIVAPGATVLEAGLAAGVPMPFSCAMGGCGACRVRLVEGEVAMDEPCCLADRERAEGYVLTCVGRAIGSVTIEVDE